MMDRNRLTIITIMLFLLSIPSVSPYVRAESGSGAIRVFVSIQPQAYFVDAVAGDRADISVLVGPGQSPATYDPSPKEIARLSEADVYFTIGVPFEKRLSDKINRMMPDLHMVDTRAGIELRRMDAYHDHENHSHDQGDFDPHTWLDPHLVEIQARTICDELTRIDPERAGTYENNLAVFRNRLDSLDKTIDSILAPYEGMHMYVFHPSYGYFADRYGLVQVAVETEGKEPGAKQLADLIRQANADDAKAIFVQAQFATTTAEALARELNIDIVQLDPLARDYMNNLLNMAHTIARAISDRQTGDNRDDES